MSVKPGSYRAANAERKVNTMARTSPPKKDEKVHDRPASRTSALSWVLSWPHGFGASLRAEGTVPEGRRRSLEPATDPDASISLMTRWG
jgi:hypothetical protein